VVTVTNPAAEEAVRSVIALLRAGKACGATGEEMDLEALVESLEAAVWNDELIRAQELLLRLRAMPMLDLEGHDWAWRVRRDLYR